ncbi:MAG: GNAT family N-acetyltransferase [Anaerolineae bacterium]|nr:GNAT family N-acetyltransferase [Anaerolineae bacterium]
MIRPVTPADSAAVAEVAVASGLFAPEDSGFLDTMMANYFAHGIHEGHECVIDVEGGVCAGVAYYEPALATDRVWYLTMIAVRRDQQGQGRGAALMRYVEDVLHKREQRMLLVETSGTATFEPTRRFYAKIGYSEEARVRDYFAPGDDMVLFRKVLNSK